MCVCLLLTQVKPRLWDEGIANYFFLLNITVDIDCLELYKTSYDIATTVAIANNEIRVKHHRHWYRSAATFLSCMFLPIFYFILFQIWRVCVFWRGAEAIGAVAIGMPELCFATIATGSATGTVNRMTFNSKDQRASWNRQSLRFLYLCSIFALSVENTRKN